MNVEIGTEVTQCPEKEYINWIFVAVHNRLPLSGTYETATALAYTLLKKNQIFFIFRNSEWSSCKVIYEEVLPNI